MLLRWSQKFPRVAFVMLSLHPSNFYVSLSYSTITMLLTNNFNKEIYRIEKCEVKFIGKSIAMIRVVCFDGMKASKKEKKRHKTCLIGSGKRFLRVTKGKLTNWRIYELTNWRIGELANWRINELTNGQFDKKQRMNSWVWRNTNRIEIITWGSLLKLLDSLL